MALAREEIMKTAMKRIDCLLSQMEMIKVCLNADMQKGKKLVDGRLGDRAMVHCLALYANLFDAGKDQDGRKVDLSKVKTDKVDADTGPETGIEILQDVINHCTTFEEGLEAIIRAH